MEQYISKSALALEIENLENTYKKCQTRNSYEEGLKNGRLIGYKDVLHKINTFEEKEIDLEKEIDRYYNIEAPKEFEDVLYEDIEKFAKHFFELGILKQTMKDD